MILDVYRLKEEMTPKQIAKRLDKVIMEDLFRNVQRLDNRITLDDGTLVAMLLPVPEKIGVPKFFPDKDVKKVILKALDLISEFTGDEVEL